MTLDKSSARIRQMFGEIAGRYDFSTGCCRWASTARGGGGRSSSCRRWAMAPILDVCTGTADLALAYWRAVEGRVARHRRHRLLPADAGDRRRKSAAVHGRHSRRPTRRRTGITLLEADTLRLPFPDDTFQIVSVAFGLRNLADTDAGLREMVRVCRPGGRVAVLEFSTPDRLAARGPLRLVLPPRPAPHRPGPGTKPSGRLQLSPAERRPLPPGRSLGRSDAGGGTAATVKYHPFHLRSGDAVRGKEG